MKPGDMKFVFAFNASAGEPGEITKSQLKELECYRAKVELAESKRLLEQLAGVLAEMRQTCTGRHWAGEIEAALGIVNSQEATHG
jgi:hypothetical protein